MKYDQFKHHRRSIRLKGYDYQSSGPYFITICVKGGACCLGDIFNGKIKLNKYGQIIEEEWLKTGQKRDHIQLDAFIVMPNHFHAIVWLVRAQVGAQEGTAQVVGAQIGVQVGAQRAAPVQSRPSEIRPDISTPQTRQFRVKPRSLGAMVRSFKSAATKRINELNSTPGHPFWHRNYYEHIIRNEHSLNDIRHYIVNNPVRWRDDKLHPSSPDMRRFVS